MQTPPGSPFDPKENVIVGNTLLYGATSGEVFINGLTGERFAVRNSGAVAVVEGVGDHGCEYMTGGIVVVLGRTGRNFAAGMSGGIAYVLDEHQLFDTLCNLDMVDLEPVHLDEDLDLLQDLIRRHCRWTGSLQAKMILDRWREMSGRFVKVMPIDYRKALRPPPRARAGQERGRGEPKCSDNRTDRPIRPSATKVHVWPTPQASSSSPAANCPTVRFRNGSRTGTKSTSRWSTRRSTSRRRAAWTAAFPSATPSGCPVKNRIPEFNDLVYRGHWRAAAENLHSTNNFPEVTGPGLPCPVRSGLHAGDQRSRR